MQPRWTLIIFFSELPQRLPAVPKNGNWNVEAALQKEKEKGRECFVGNVAPRCLPSSVRQVEGATVLTLWLVWDRTGWTLRTADSGQHAGWNTLGILISLISTQGLPLLPWQLPLAPEFAMRKTALQLLWAVTSRRGKEKNNLSGKQVRWQMQPTLI